MEQLTDPDQVTDRLVAVAPLSDQIVAIDQTEGAWVVGFRDAPVVLMEWVNQPDRLVLSAMIGAPPREREVEVLETALSYTALWQDGGGAKVAKGGADGELVLIRELHPELEGGWDLLPVLEHFANVAAWWWHYVSTEAVAEQAVRLSPVDILQLRA